MIIDVSYNWFLVGLSFFVAVFGSFTALQLMRGIRSTAGKAKGFWLVTAAFALGGGAIWTMHFIGMIAYQSSMPVGYDLGTTFLSLLIAVAVVGLGLWILSRKQDSVLVLLLSGLITGLGVAAMHYTGMEAMVMAADITYDTALFAISIVIAVVAATVALWLAFNLRGNLQMFIASIVMGIAVCGMHYTGMAAMLMTPNGADVALASSMEPITLGLFIFCFSMLLLLLALIGMLSQIQKQMYQELESEGEIEVQVA